MQHATPLVPVELQLMGLQVPGLQTQTSSQWAMFHADLILQGGLRFVWRTSCNGER